MSGFDGWIAAPTVTVALERLGWRAEDAAARELLPAIARGTNVVAIAPPSPAWAALVIGGLLGTLEARSGRILVLTAPALVPEWGALADALAEGSSFQIEAARGHQRAESRLKGEAVDLLVASPETALTLLTRSALAPERFTTVVFAWPEGWDSDDAVAALLQDLPKEAQRIVLTARQDGVDGSAGIAERYARKALIVGPPPPALPADSIVRSNPVRTLATSWAGRSAATARLVEEFDQADVTIWTADTRDHVLLRRALGGTGDGVSFGVRNIPARGLIVCYDLPSRDQLRHLASVGDVVLVVPPGCERHVAEIAPGARPVQGDAALGALQGRHAAMRGAILKELGREADSSALYALAPLFEGFDAQMVAAALLRLWQAAEGRNATMQLPPAPPRGLATPAGGAETTKLWVGVGKSDEATVGDLVAVLVKEVKVDRALIGRIELRDTFSLVEVPVVDAERIARGLTGLTVRRRKLSARVDRGPSRPTKARAPR